ncbi:redoxin domain-containing protein [Pedobacter agri]|uniref:redoxin domain-containing protein n=1 Tax=Pedobacter agri TaxID=454586 RepID=UPI00293114F5|nr:redoxin domain-containing protein [Pedobacter agri]
MWEKLSRISLVTTGGKYSKPLVHGNTVVIFLSPECPLCKNYVPVLNGLKSKYPGVSIIGLVPGNSYSVSEVNQFIEEYNVRFEVYLDRYKEIVKLLGARTTPEVFLVDKCGQLRYRGLIDNWAVSLGVKRKITTAKFLEEALNGLTLDKFQYKETAAVGCLINDL